MTYLQRETLIEGYLKKRGKISSTNYFFRLYKIVSRETLHHKLCWYKSNKPDEKVIGEIDIPTLILVTKDETLKLSITYSKKGNDKDLHLIANNEADRNEWASRFKRLLPRVSISSAKLSDPFAMIGVQAEIIKAEKKPDEKSKPESISSPSSTCLAWQSSPIQRPAAALREEEPYFNYEFNKNNEVLRQGPVKPSRANVPLPPPEDEGDYFNSAIQEEVLMAEKTSSLSSSQSSTKSANVKSNNVICFPGAPRRNNPDLPSRPSIDKQVENESSGRVVGLGQVSNNKNLNSPPVATPRASLLQQNSKVATNESRPLPSSPSSTTTTESCQQIVTKFEPRRKALPSTPTPPSAATLSKEVKQESIDKVEEEYYNTVFSTTTSPTVSTNTKQNDFSKIKNEEIKKRLPLPPPPILPRASSSSSTLPASDMNKFPKVKEEEVNFYENISQIPVDRGGGGAATFSSPPSSKGFTQTMQTKTIADRRNLPLPQIVNLEDDYANDGDEDKNKKDKIEEENEYFNGTNEQNTMKNSSVQVKTSHQKNGKQSISQTYANLQQPAAAGDDEGVYFESKDCKPMNNLHSNNNKNNNKMYRK